MRRRHGKILAVKLGVNPNSSSLGADVTLLLFGAAALSFLTPIAGALIRWKLRPSTPGSVLRTEPSAQDERGDDVPPA